MSEVTVQSHINYFSMNPSYALHVESRELAPGWAAPVGHFEHLILDSLTEDELQTFISYFIRRGAVKLTVTRNDPLYNFGQATTDE